MASPESYTPIPPDEALDAAAAADEAHFRNLEAQYNTIPAFVIPESEFNSIQAVGDQTQEDRQFDYVFHHAAAALKDRAISEPTADALASEIAFQSMAVRRLNNGENLSDDFIAALKASRQEVARLQEAEAASGSYDDDLLRLPLISRAVNDVEFGSTGLSNLAGGEKNA